MSTVLTKLLPLDNIKSKLHLSHCFHMKISIPLKNTLATSCLTTSNLPCFMDLTLQVPRKYCSLQCQTLLSPPDTPTNECCFHFGPAASFFLNLPVTALCSSPVAYGTPSELGSSSFSVKSFAFSYCPWGSPAKTLGMGCHFLL